MAKAAGFVRGQSATLFYKSVVAQTGSIAYDSGIDHRYTRSYFETYIKLDPATVGHFFAEVDEPMSTADLVPYDEFIESRFYREWARPQGLVDFVAAVLDKSATTAALFGVFRNERQGLVDDEMRRRMRLIVPHVRRAVLIGRLLDLKGAEAAALADTFDAISPAMFLVNAERRIVHANTAGHAIIAAGHLLHASAGRLTARSVQIQQTLGAAVTASAAGDAALGVIGIAVSLGNYDGANFVAHVLPLTSGARRRTGATYSAVAAIFVRKAEMGAPAPPQIIAETFKLTPTELRVLLAIVEIGGTPAVAEALGIAETTVKTHLGRVFEKTGVRRQADLVRLFAGFAAP